jgi:hypothetical protein
MNAGRPDKLDSRQIEGRYANYFQVGHNAFEVIVDFGQLYEESPDVRFHTRIIMAPAYAVRLLETLAKSVAEFERTFGPAEGGPGPRQ